MLIALLAAPALFGLTSLTLAALGRRRTVVAFVALALGCLTVGAGLVGTVVGLRVAFGAVEHAEASRKAELLAEGIRQAMLSTAVGLVLGAVAITASALAVRAATKHQHPAPR